MADRGDLLSVSSSHQSQDYFDLSPIIVEILNGNTNHAKKVGNNVLTYIVQPGHPYWYKLGFKVYKVRRRVMSIPSPADVYNMLITNNLQLYSYYFIVLQKDKVSVIPATSLYEHDVFGRLQYNSRLGKVFGDYKSLHQYGLILKCS